jgi:pyruvate/2-oxoglutarate/acetoin dehydrogenase E1 component
VSAATAAGPARAADPATAAGPAGPSGGRATGGGRVVDALNGALHRLFQRDERLVLLGEDVLDPYGGAFGVTRGLSTRFPDRILGTPISEQAITGVAGGLALTGRAVIVEVMFGDFATLCFDPLVNFIAKSVSMYGRRLPMPVVLRCPVGGNRGYGPTHSQSPQKHFLGVPQLGLYELSPLHDPYRTLESILGTGEPAVLFEDKVLYTRPLRTGTRIGGPFLRRPIGGDNDWVEVAVDDGSGGDTPADWAVVCTGGVAPRVLDAMGSALSTHETLTRLVVPSRLFPLDLGPVLPSLLSARRVLVVEDGVAGGGWAGEVARQAYERLWGRLREPVRVVQPPCATIPAAPPLERRVLVQSSTIYRALTGEADA